MPKLLGPLWVAVVAFLTVAVACLLFDYTSIKRLEHDLAQLEKERKDQEDRFAVMAGEITLLADRLAESQGLTGHDRAISALREAIGRVSSNQEQGTKRPATMISEFLASEPYENMIRRMHDSLDYLHAEVNAVALLRQSEGYALAFNADESEHSITARQAARIYKRTMIKSRLRAVAQELGLAPRLALSMAQVESGFNPKAVSPRGAVGVLQIMPSLASEHFEVDPQLLFDPEINIRVGLLHMKYLLERFDNNIDLSLAAYNAGVRRVILAGYRIPPITETRDYVRKVKAAMNDYVAVTSWDN